MSKSSLSKYLATSLLAVPLYSTSLPTIAGQLISGATITSINNTGANLDNFQITVSGGSGVCSNTQIHFPSFAASDYKDGRSAIFDRAYAAALTAFSSGSKVDIYNYQDDNCLLATYILLKK